MSFASICRCRKAALAVVLRECIATKIGCGTASSTADYARPVARRDHGFPAAGHPPQLSWSPAHGIDLAANDRDCRRRRRRVVTVPDNRCERRRHQIDLAVTQCAWQSQAAPRARSERGVVLSIAAYHGGIVEQTRGSSTKGRKVGDRGRRIYGILRGITRNPVLIDVNQEPRELTSRSGRLRSRKLWRPRAFLPPRPARLSCPSFASTTARSAMGNRGPSQPPCARNFTATRSGVKEDLHKPSAAAPNLCLRRLADVACK